MWLCALVGVTAVLAAGCDDTLLVTLPTVPDSVLLHSITSGWTNSVNGFDLAYGLPVVIEAAGATGTWDVALGRSDGALALMPPGAFGIASNVAVAAMDGSTFGDVAEAPADSALYVADEPVVLTLGGVYVVRTRQVSDIYGSTCSLYAKVEAVELDDASERALFAYLTNPVCYDLRLAQ